MSQNQEKSSAELLEVGGRTNSPSYAPAQFILDRGEGVWLWDREGNKYLDFVAGIAVNYRRSITKGPADG